MGRDHGDGMVFGVGEVGREGVLLVLGGPLNANGGMCWSACSLFGSARLSLLIENVTSRLDHTRGFPFKYTSPMNALLFPSLSYWLLPSKLGLSFEPWNLM